jgi:hypothetical protein
MVPNNLKIPADCMGRSEMLEQIIKLIIGDRIADTIDLEFSYVEKKKDLKFNPNSGHGISNRLTGEVLTGEQATARENEYIQVRAGVEPKLWKAYRSGELQTYLEDENGIRRSIAPGIWDAPAQLEDVVEFVKRTDFDGWLQNADFKPIPEPQADHGKPPTDVAKPAKPKRGGGKRPGDYYDVLKSDLIRYHRTHEQDGGIAGADNIKLARWFVQQCGIRKETDTNYRFDVPSVNHLRGVIAKLKDEIL